MANLNKVMLIGRLTRDPELKYIPSGAAVAEFGFAVNRVYYTNEGEKREETCFLEVSAWRKLGEMAHNYLSKGRQVFVEGYLKFEQWQTQDGQKRSRISVVAMGLQFLDSGRGESDGRPPMSQKAPEANAGGGSGGSGGPESSGMPMDSVQDNADECPF